MKRTTWRSKWIIGGSPKDISHPKTAYSCKKSARPSKAELTVTKSNDIIMRPCVRCAS